MTSQFSSMMRFSPSFLVTAFQNSPCSALMHPAPLVDAVREQRMLDFCYGNSAPELSQKLVELVHIPLTYIVRSGMSP